LKVGTQFKPSVFTEIKSSEESPSLSRSQEKTSVFGRLGKIIFENKNKNILQKHENIFQSEPNPSTLIPVLQNNI